MQSICCLSSDQVQQLKQKFKEITLVSQFICCMIISVIDNNDEFDCKIYFSKDVFQYTIVFTSKTLNLIPFVTKFNQFFVWTMQKYLHISIFNHCLSTIFNEKDLLCHFTDSLTFIQPNEASALCSRLMKTDVKLSDDYFHGINLPPFLYHVLF